MSIRINWVNPNNQFDRIKIYRSTTKFTKNNPPEMLAEIPSGTTYLDTTSVLDTLYWYAIGVVSGVDESISVLNPAIQLSSYGPGPTELLRGNNEFGYFGTVTQEQLFTATEVQVGVGVTATTVGVITWEKFIYQGKILYLPSRALHTGLSWNALYGIGCVFGTDDTGLGAHGLAPKNQRKIISKGDDDFIVRLPRFTTRQDGAPPVVGGREISTSDPSIYGSEWVQCMCVLYGASLGVFPGRYAPVHNKVAVAPEWPISGNPCATMGMEYSGATSMVSIGAPVSIYNGHASYNRTTPLSWRPVLELAPPVRA